MSNGYVEHQNMTVLSSDFASFIWSQFTPRKRIEITDFVLFSKETNIFLRSWLITPVYELLLRWTQENRLINRSRQAGREQRDSLPSFREIQSNVERITKELWHGARREWWTSTASAVINSASKIGLSHEVWWSPYSLWKGTCHCLNA